MLKLFILVVVVAAVSAGISPSCLRAICLVESGCKPLGCKFDVSSTACGYFQIHRAYYTDCKAAGVSISTWHSCSKNKACAETCVHRYLNRYAPRCTSHAVPTCEDYARVHNGGPSGCKKDATVGYWHKVRSHL